MVKAHSAGASGRRLVVGSQHHSVMSTSPLPKHLFLSSNRLLVASLKHSKTSLSGQPRLIKHISVRDKKLFTSKIFWPILRTDLKIQHNILPKLEAFWTQKYISYLKKFLFYFFFFYWNFYQFCISCLLLC